MKIVHLITRLILGGAQENTLLTCKGLARAGHDVTLAYGPIYGPEGSLLDEAAQSGCRLVELPAMVRAVHPIKDPACYRQCRDLIRRTAPDVVHTHSSKAGIVGRAAAWRVRQSAGSARPLIVHTIHGLPFHDYQPWPVRRAYIAAERWAARRCDKLVTVADAMTRQALAAGIGVADQYQTVYSGMDVRAFLDEDSDPRATRAALHLNPNDFVIGTVARLADLKGHDDLLDALGAMLNQNPHMKLLWVGDGWLRARLEKRIAEMGLTGQVALTGLVPPSRIAPLIRCMDVLVHPSYREGLARALPQALLCGVPVISYNLDGASEVCLDGQTGRLIAPGDTAALAKAVKELHDDPGARQRMAEAGRDLCTERFDADLMVRRLEALYRDLLAERSADR